MSYWDTSALVKLYIAEPDSPYFLQLITGDDEPIVSFGNSDYRDTLLTEKSGLGR